MVFGGTLDGRAIDWSPPSMPDLVAAAKT